MKKRLDGVFVCDHSPYAYMQKNRISVRCFDCPMYLSPSDVTIGQLIKFTDARLGKMYVDKENNTFEIAGRIA